MRRHSIESGTEHRAVVVRRKTGWRFIVAAIIATVAIGTYNTIMIGLAHRYDDRQQRDPRTDALRGAEDFEFGPRDADNAVVLVHGFLGASNNFNELPQRLAAAGYRVRGLRLPGHGTTPFDLEKTGPSEELNFILGEVRLLKQRHKKVFLVGHSMGGALSVLAATSPDVDGLVLAGPHFRVTHRWFYGLPIETWNALTGWAVRWVYKSDAFIQVDRPEAKREIVSYRYVPAKAVALIDHFAALARDPVTLGMVECPVLMLHGKNDLAASPDAAEKAFNSMASKDKKLVLLDRSNHHIFWDYDREQVYTEILDFLAAKSVGTN